MSNVLECSSADFEGGKVLSCFGSDFVTAKGQSTILPLTLSEALEQGYRYGATKWTAGYVSRRADTMHQRLHVAGGSREGQLFALLPSWRSTSFCYRQYLLPPEKED